MVILEKSTYLHLFLGKQVLIVEDEYFLTDESRREIEKLGASVVGPTANVLEAMEMLGFLRVDAAILDIHLDDDRVFQIVEELENKEIPFLFATGGSLSSLPSNFTGFVLCEKSIELEKIADSLFRTGSNAVWN